MGETTRFGFKTLDEGDSLADDSYKFTHADREQLDRILAFFETHTHTGETTSDTSPVAGPELDLDTEGGNIPAGQRVRYRYTLVDPSGLETAASPEAYVDTPDPIDNPAAPSLSTANVGGTLIPGQYYYVLTAYQDFTTSETKATNPAHITVPAGTNTNENTLALPDVPFGATGFNVYRRAPGHTRYFYLDSVDMDGPTPPTDYIDDGTVDEDCDRTIPAANTTFSTNAITATIGGATPTVPDGYTWKLYRTYESGNYDDSLLWWIVEETSEGSGIITPVYEDTGAGTTTGTPPTASQSIDHPPKNDLTDMANVDGYLPVGRNLVPVQVNFDVDVSGVATGTYVWTCDYAQAQIVAVRVTGSIGNEPSTTDVIVDVNKFDATAATPSWASIFTDQADRPRLEVGDLIGIQSVPAIQLLTTGDALSVDVDQDDPNVTGTTITVSVLLVAVYGSADVSWVWAED